MPNVLILGATGYVGLPLAKSLLSSGNYTVYGLARNAAKAKLLTQNEITPVIGDVKEPSSFTGLISSAPIDIVIDTTSAYEQAPTILKAVAAASKSRINALAKEGAVAPKLGFVYVSGTWVHGSPSAPVSDLHPVGSSLSKGTPATAVGWRGGHEQAILAERDVLDVAIVRPAAVYGGTSWVWSLFWGPILAAAKSGSTEPIKLPAGEEARPVIIHVNDVVSGMHCVVDRVHGLLGSWPVFDLLGETVMLKDMVEGVKDILGVKAKLEYAGTQGNPFYEAMGLVTNSASTRANIVMGWAPKRLAFLMNLATYVKAWEAAQEEK